MPSNASIQKAFKDLIFSLMLGVAFHNKLIAQYFVIDVGIPYRLTAKTHSPARILTMRRLYYNVLLRNLDLLIAVF